MALGLRKGDRVLLISENRPEWAIVDYACACAGGILVPVYTNLTVPQLNYILENSGALLAMVHDVIMVSGYYLVTRREFNLTSIAVLLTITGYSINDTIVIYDRIREEMARYKGKPLPEIINIAVNDTLSRTILTSGVTALSLVGLLIFGVGEIWDFAMAMLVGIIVGTYSSVYIASPLTIWLDERAARKKASGGAMKVRAA